MDILNLLEEEMDSLRPLICENAKIGRLWNILTHAMSVG